MAKTVSNKTGKITFSTRGGGTTIGRGSIKFSTMNKSKRRSYKAYRGQGK